MENLGFSKSREDVLADTRKWMNSNLSLDGVSGTDQNNNQIGKPNAYNTAGSTAGYSSMNQGSAGYSTGSTYGSNSSQGYSQQPYSNSSSGAGYGVSSGYSNPGSSAQGSQYGYNQQNYGNYGQGNSYSSSYSTYNTGNSSASNPNTTNYSYTNTQNNSSSSQVNQYPYSSQSTGNASGQSGGNPAYNKTYGQTGATTLGSNSGAYQAGAGSSSTQSSAQSSSNYGSSASGMYGSSYSSNQSSTFDNNLQSSIQKQVYDVTKETLQSQYGNLYQQNNKPMGTETSTSSLSPAEMWPINCIACNFPIKNIKNLYRHIDGHWWKDRNCIICTVPVPGNVSNFQVHLKTHCGETMYVCSSSKRSFLSKDKVLQHVMQQKNTSTTSQGRLYYEFLIDVTSAENAKSDSESTPTTKPDGNANPTGAGQTTTAGGAANARYFPELYDKVQSNLGSSILQGTNTGSYGANSTMSSSTSNNNLGYSTAYKATPGATGSTTGQNSAQTTTNPSQNAGSYTASYGMQTTSTNASSLQTGMAVYSQANTTGTQNNPSYTTSYKMPQGGSYNATTYNSSSVTVTQASTYPAQSNLGYTTSYKTPAGTSNPTTYNNGIALAPKTSTATSNYPSSNPASNYSSSSSSVKPAYDYNTSKAPTSFSYSGPNGTQNQYQRSVYPTTTATTTSTTYNRNNTGNSYFSNTQTTYGNASTNQQPYSAAQNTYQKPLQPGNNGMANAGSNPNFPNSSYNTMQGQQTTNYNQPTGVNNAAGMAAMFGGQQPEQLPDGTLVCKECKFQAKQPRYLQAHMKRMHSTPQNSMYNITYNYSVPQPTQPAVPVPPAVKPPIMQPIQPGMPTQPMQPTQDALANNLPKGFINPDCNECDRPSSNLEKFYLTWKEDFSDRAFCVLCGFKTYTGEARIKERNAQEEEASFQRHLEVHVGQDLFVCGMCKVSSSTMDVMAKHVDAHNQRAKKEAKDGKKEEEVNYIRYAITAQWQLRNYCEHKKDTKPNTNSMVNNGMGVNNRQATNYSNNRYTYVGPPPPQTR